MATCVKHPHIQLDHVNGLIMEVCPLCQLEEEAAEKQEDIDKTKKLKIWCLKTPKCTEQCDQCLLSMWASY